MNGTTSYGDAIRLGFEYLLGKYSNVFAIGQGLWSPWYVGNSMTDVDKKFGRSRVMDTPICELACTGVAIGASLCGYRPIVIHPRMDFMLLAVDQIVNQAAKWSSMFGGQANAPVTFRAIINRGGEQGAQHSQALHSWFAHVPGLRVVMPATPADARDLLISAVLCDDPVMYIDDRWLYEVEAEIGPVLELSLRDEGPSILRNGADVTLVGVGYSTLLCQQAAQELASAGIEAEVIDLRVLNPLRTERIAESVEKTRRLCVVDGGWRTAGIAGEVLARIVESTDIGTFSARPMRVTIADAPAPTSRPLESIYYPTARTVVAAVKSMMEAGARSEVRQ